MTKELFLDILGWIGVVMILIGYLLITFKVLVTQNIGYQSLNLFGALGVVISSGAKKNYQIVVLNSIWFIAAAISIYQILVG